MASSDPSSASTSINEELDNTNMEINQLNTANASPIAPIIPNSLWHSPKYIKEGALVILFENHQSLTYCYVKANEIYQNRHGAFYHNDMINQPYGTKIISRKRGTKGYMIVLAPTPELWSRALRHRTQIVFTLDASAILFAASLRSGHRVVESGTGSGALTTSFARTVAPYGHVYTFEFNATRADIAKKEFQRNGLGEIVTIECRDACAQGFPSTLNGTIDLVFLDLPCPWLAIDHAVKMLCEGGTFASYSPCIEQVQKTCDGLRDAGFELIRTIETRLVPYSSRKIDLPKPNFSRSSTHNTTMEDISQEIVKQDDLSPNESNTEDLVPHQSNLDAEEPGTATTNPNKRKFNESQGVNADELASPGISKKKQKFNTSQGEHVVAKPDTEIRGHTAFLTFAKKFFS